MFKMKKIKHQHDATVKNERLFESDFISSLLLNIYAAFYCCKSVAKVLHFFCDKIIKVLIINELREVTKCNTFATVSVTKCCKKNIIVTTCISSSYFFVCNICATLLQHLATVVKV
jgi:hypothetical protein